MIDLKHFQEIPRLAIDFVDSLKINNKYNYVPTNNYSTASGKKINLGFNCYALKLYKITNKWNDLNEIDRNNWRNYILNFQNHQISDYKNYFIDKEVYDYFNKYLSSFNAKENVKIVLNKVAGKNYQNKSVHIFKTLNADNKQTISTLNEIDVEVSRIPDISYGLYNDVESYLNSYDWRKPWDAGAQFSSYSVYSKVYGVGIANNLSKFIKTKLNKDTGSYFDGDDIGTRQVINGAMKVISGLDWLNEEIHMPEKLIDFCLNNKPEFEGCDLVDYVYVLYKCSSQTDYKKQEIKELLKDILKYLNLLYHEEKKGFSYFVNKSQTHYYGIEISKGNNVPDIHGTLLSVWAIVMILEILEKNIYNYKTIKP